MPPSPVLPQATTDYSTAYNSFGYKYDPQVDELHTELNALPGQRAAAQSSLDQARANAFKTIGTNSNTRGLLFSGYQAENQGNYDTNTYNPANVDLGNKISASQTSLTQKIADINNQRAIDAASLVQSTKDDQAAAALSASKASASAAKSASSKAAKAAQPTTNSIANAIRLNLSHASGQDSFVSPEDYAAAYTDWINNGQSASSFNSTFGQFKNPNNSYYQYAINSALKRN